ncbi:MarC family protein [Bacteroides sp. 224]|uniref:MarC family protein n=1 Tax=Bacteroides sp. 224 TaxID=2302936 RepID=UPI0013D21123|nr:MarC family protein [Bacteroides sp. 224]NDV64840.1 MarC family protein [Bacteroides sp. 224]
MSIHDFIYTFVSAFVALFPVTNPISSGFIINGFISDLNDDQRKIVIKKIIINCLVIGIGSLLIGRLILLIFNLAIPVVQLAGGILICKTGLEWLSDTSSSKDDTKEDAINKINLEEIEKKIFYPISFPISLGPGSISVILTLIASSTVKDNLLATSINYVLIALVIVALCVILYLFLTGGQRMMKKIGKSGNLVINKMVAFFTFCIGLQIMVTGISKIFHLNIL